MRVIFLADATGDTRHFEAGNRFGLLDSLFKVWLWGRGFLFNDVVDASEACATQTRNLARWHYFQHDEVRVCVGPTKCKFAFRLWSKRGGFNELVVELADGDWILIPAGTVHRFEGLGVLQRHSKRRHPGKSWEPLFAD